ncbi:MAG: B12-binding domain-containing radical SAM protein [Clostridium argentinense]|uniref:B12-binding domain-containing radical SAM protein n=1 Tax=Clostridium butanoliproducens TaxID=2991837 RepID=UPI001D235F31|nr:B12-binding domain-containing radical SAM protein [Clostridium butanoliproducens]MBS5824929.1 B12-binding domain-containing radical SAM protein [Clostridium argentinense]MDU1348692.1 B12-binding domain-containing radical SAM protein [Clostridium argentinense]
MNVLLVGVNAKYIHSNLAVRYLKAYTKDMDYNCDIVEFSVNDRVERIVEEIMERKPRILGFSCYIWNSEYITKISTLIKKIDDSIDIFYGGPEVSYDSESFLKANYGEYVIEGEGEETYREFIKNKISEYKNEEVNYKNIRGLYSKENGEIYYGGSRPLMDMNKIVFPYEEGEDLSYKIVYYEASRGCPFKCKYCLSSTSHGVRFIDIEKVKKDLKYFVDKKVKLVKFVDRTFNCNERFANEIWNYLIDLGGETRFHFEISADLLRDKSIKTLSRAKEGLFQFEIGVQTTNDEVLKNINRNVNFSTIKEKVEELKCLKNIMQHLDLIAGLPGEDFNSFKKSFNDVYSIAPDELQLGFLKLLKGSSMREEAELWGMKYSPYPPYEVLKTKNISYDELILLKNIEHMVDKYLNSKKFNNILNYFIKNNNFFDTPFDFYEQLSLFYKEKGYFKRNISSSEYYKVFFDFNNEILRVDDKLLCDLIKFDYLTYNKKRGIPNFIYREGEKNVEKQIKEKLIENNLIKSSNDVHIEKFTYDLNQYFVNNLVVEKDFYVCFYNNSNKILMDAGKYLKN